MCVCVWVTLNEVVVVVVVGFGKKPIGLLFVDIKKKVFTYILLLLLYP